MTRYVIIGNSAGGVGAAEAIREIDRHGALTLVSEEPYVAYSRPLIAQFLAGERTIERMNYRPADFYASRDIRLQLGQALAGIDLARRQVALAGGQEIPWDRLLLAVGGSPLIPPAEGLHEHDFYSFTTLDDARRLQAHLPGKRHVVVVGGGLIGMSVTEALVKLGLSVTIVELAPQILGRALDAEAAGMARTALESAGVRVLTQHSIARIIGQPGERSVSSVVLDNGEELPCDTLIIAVGVRPRIEPARAAGLTIGRGIVVDRHMATSDPAVYACGDVAEGYDFVVGGSRLTPIWPNAYLGGRVAGRNMAGVEAIYTGGTAMNSLHSFGISIMSAGTVDPPADDPTYRVLRKDDRAQGRYRKIVLQSGRVVGMIFAGCIERAGVVYGLMKSGVDVSAFGERLLADDLGLFSLPRGLRAELLRAS
jgi:NAD(P)H-nitrite reductase large subunit